MEKIFHWTNTFKTLGETDDGGIDIKGSASTNALDRAGDIIEAERSESTRLNSSHTVISYAVFCLKKKTIKKE